MTLDLICILCSVRVLNPLIREGELALLFASTNTSHLRAKVASAPKRGARYLSFPFSYVLSSNNQSAALKKLTSAGLCIPLVPLPTVR